MPNEDHCVANMDRKECGCRMWELTGIPCKHVVAAINYMNEDEEQLVYLKSGFMLLTD